MIEFLDFGEAHVDLGATRTSTLVKEIGDAVKRLRTKNNVDPRGALQNVLAFLTRHATAHGDAHFGTLFFHFADAAEVGEDLFLSLLANRAGVDHDEIGLFEIFGALVRLSVSKQVREATGVVVVHLAAEAAHVQFFRWHGLCPVTIKNQNDANKKAPPYGRAFLLNSGGASRTRTADTRIMIPLL